MVPFGKIDHWKHLWVLNQYYLQIGTELKIGFDTYHHSSISSNSSLKLCTSPCWEKYEVRAFSCKMQDHIFSVMLYTFLFLHWFSNPYHTWNLLHKYVLHALSVYSLLSLLSLYLVLSNIQGCILIMTSSHLSSKVAVLLQQTYLFTLCDINLFRRVSPIR